MKMGAGTILMALAVLYIASYFTVKGALINLLVVVLGMVIARIVYVSERKKQNS